MLQPLAKGNLVLLKPKNLVNVDSILARLHQKPSELSPSESNVQSQLKGRTALLYPMAYYLLLILLTPLQASDTTLPSQKGSPGLSCAEIIIYE